MNFEEYVAIGFGLIFAGILGTFIFKKMPKKLKRDYYTLRWKRLQQKLPDQNSWAQAICAADDLLDEALKRKKYKGKNMGERLVDAQKNFSNNEAVWFGHKLRTKLDINPDMPLRKEDVQKALYGLRQGLKDVGAL